MSRTNNRIEYDLTDHHDVNAIEGLAWKFERKMATLERIFKRHIDEGHRVPTIAEISLYQRIERKRDIVKRLARQSAGLNPYLREK